MEIKNWLINWFSDKLDCEKTDINVESNFFEVEYIDSLKIFELIVEIESYYNIRFNNIDFLDEQVHSISGLAKLINNKTEGKYKNE